MSFSRWAAFVLFFVPLASGAFIPVLVSIMLISGDALVICPRCRSPASVAMLGTRVTFYVLLNERRRDFQRISWLSFLSLLTVLTCCLFFSASFLRSLSIGI